jgi:hypothetical protein
LTLGDYHASLQVLHNLEEMSGPTAILARLVSEMHLLNSHTGMQEKKDVAGKKSKFRSFCCLKKINYVPGVCWVEERRGKRGGGREEGGRKEGGREELEKGILILNFFRKRRICTCLINFF